jgi:hypothetical protein
MNKVLHAIGTVLFGYTLYYDFFYVRTPAKLLTEYPILMAAAKWPGKWKFLTYWNLIMMFAFQALSFVNDFLGSNSQDTHRQTKLQKYRDYIFASTIFPVGFFVSVSFWGLYAVDRELVFPKVHDEYVPSLFNHAVHTAPAVFILLESFLIPKIFPKRSASLVGNATFTLAYVLWILWIALVTDVWVYPVLAVLNTPARILFIGGSIFLFAIMYLIGEKFQGFIWGAKGLTDSHAKKTSNSKIKKKQ